ncbi:MAG: penicillin-binding transpeptidase domain-containing protein [Roseiflexaceae bacterium]
MNRLLLPRIVALLIFVALVGRLYQLQLVDTESNKYRYATQVRTTRFLPVRPIRGEIFAADGKTLLAESVPIYSASIRPADLPDPTTAPRERAAIFAQLGQLLGISTTLTISPVIALDQDPVLRNDLIQGLGLATVAGAQRQSNIPPLHFATTPAQSAEAAALATRYRAVVRFQIEGAPGQVDSPAGSGQRNAAPEPTQAAATPALTGTLTISPAAALEQNPILRADLRRLLGHDAIEAAAPPATISWATLTVPPARSMAALKLSETYTTSLRLASPIAAQVARANVPGYQTIIVKQDIPRSVALVLRENAASLPGVTVELDYRRRYPLSEQVQSLSHMLGFIGRVDECDLARGNPARSWMMSLLESVSHAAECGFVQKQLNPTSLGMAHYLNDDRIGKDGLEGSYEQDLRGQLGMEAILVDALNRPVRAPEVVQPAHDGDNLILTIDAGFQRQVEQILRNWIAVGEQRRLQQTGVFAFKRDYKPIRSGVAIVMEVRTGRVLAMVSWPAYDNNVWDPARSSDWASVFAPTDPEAQKELVRLAPLVNHAIAGQYPPGSTLKQFDASIALQAQVITPDTKVHDAGKLLLEGQFGSGQFPYVNAGSRAYGDITVRDALRVSSNIFFMSVVGGNSDHVINLKPEEKNIEEGLGITRFADGLSMFGFGQPTGIRLAGELKGRVPTPKWKQEALLQAWTTGDTYNVAIGQGNLEVTPLQLISAGVAVANSGELYQPQIVKAITDSSGNIRQEIQPQLARHIDVDPRYFAVVREGMRSSVTDGPNVAARDACSGLSIAGKTGTAEYGPEILVPTNDGKSTHLIRQSHSWFVGFAPYDDPQIEVLALVEGTGDLGDGSATIAVPAVTQIMQAYFKAAPPNPLPRGCQEDLPPLPARVDPAAPTGAHVRSGPGR